LRCQEEHGEFTDEELAELAPGSSGWQKTAVRRAGRDRARRTAVLDFHGLSAWVAQDRRTLATFQMVHTMGADFVISSNAIVEVSLGI
jgi:hypothetical protein